jgi:hypothetical protein
MTYNLVMLDVIELECFLLHSSSSDSDTTHKVMKSAFRDVCGKRINS